jgi:mannitol-1-phosphate 5-dehydrogenase
MCRQYDIPVQHILVGIAAALLYDDTKGDPQAKDLQEKIADKGLESTIVEITGFEASGHQVKGIMEAYERLKSSRVSRK